MGDWYEFFCTHMYEYLDTDGKKVQCAWSEISLNAALSHIADTGHKVEIRHHG